VTRLWVFLHLLGFTWWLGGGFAAMLAGIAAKREDRAGLGAVVRSQAAVHRAAILPGALLAVLSGVMLTFGLSSRIAGFNIWLVIMQAAGVIAALLALFVSVPTASRLARLDPVANAAAFDELRARQKIVASIWGTLGLIALLAGAMVRFVGPAAG
jgi:hypothetical protein